MAQKGEDIQRRLDDLEEDLKFLKEKLVEQTISASEDEEITGDLMPCCKKSIQQHSPFTKQHRPQGILRKPEKIPKGGKQINGLKCSFEMNELFQVPVFTCLQSAGNEEIKKITSLTEISSISSLPSTFALPSNFKNDCYLKQNILDHLIDEPPLKSFEKKPKLGIRKKKTTSSDTTISKINSVKELRNERELKKKLEEENESLKIRLNSFKRTSAQVTSLKKELSEEKQKREVVEKNLLECKASLQVFEERPKHSEKKIEELCQELKNEKESRLKIEFNYQKLQSTMEVNRRKYNDMKDSKRLAIVMADQVRQQYEEISSKEYRHNFLIIELEEKIKTLSLELNETKIKYEKKNGENRMLKKNLEEFKIVKTKDWQKQKAESIMKIQTLEKELAWKEEEIKTNKERNPMEDPRVIDEMDKFKNKYTELINEWKNKENELMEKCNKLQKEVDEALENQKNKSFQIQLRCNELKNEAEKKDVIIETLNIKIKELTEVINVEKKRNEEVCSIQKHQEDLIRNLNETISSKDNHIKILNKEGNINLKKCELLNKQVTELSKNMEILYSENAQLRNDFAREAEMVLIKDKMLNDQLNSIKTLRKSLEEVRTSLEKERAEYLKLSKDYNHAEYHKNEFKKRIAGLEYELEDCKQQEEKQQKLLDELENQIYEKQSEWESHFQKLSFEKEQVIENARSTAKKLIQVNSDYQSRLMTNKQTITNLNNSLDYKDYQLEVAFNEINGLSKQLLEVNQASQKMKNSLQNNLLKVCEVCTDVIDDYHGGPT